MLLLTTTTVESQITNVTFLNTGQMNVAPNGATGVSLYVPDAMRQFTVAGRTVQIVHNGITELGGNFYQESQTTVFQVGSDTKTTSTGKFRFVRDAGVNRTINTQTENINTFDRGTRYVAFPNIEISTNDSIVLPGKIGVDAITLKRVNGKTGHFILRSDVVTDAKGTNAYDASLRITGAGASSSVVDLGSVVVERNMTVYRPNDGSTQMFGFATPFKNTQLSGYYAGNWVRRPLNTGTYGHTTYVYGNKDTAPADGVIDGDQYVYLAAETLTPAQAYLIKPRAKGFNYSTLQAEFGLWYTGEPNASLYDKGKYYFNGKVYTVTPYLEQLYADDVLYTNTVNATPSTTVNLLVGNSYTCPIPTSLLAQTMQASGLVFSPYIYVFPAGSSTYQSLSISSAGGSIIVADVTEIPAMSVFMVRLAKNSVQNGTLNLGKALQRHADVAHNKPQTAPSSTGEVRQASAQSYNVAENQVTFKVSPASNENIYDLAAIGLRQSATYESDTYDMAKAYVNDDDIFQMYTLSSTKSMLSANGVPLNADSVVLAFKPSKVDGEFKLTTKYLETLESEGLWLYDLKLHQLVDMKNTDSYTFDSKSYDKPERFLVYFKKPVNTEIKIPENNLDLYYNENKLYVKLLTPEDMGSQINIYDTQGRLINNVTVNNYPEMTIPAKIGQGVYMVNLSGSRNANAKFVKNN